MFKNGFIERNPNHLLAVTVTVCGTVLVTVTVAAAGHVLAVSVTPPGCGVTVSVAPDGCVASTVLDGWADWAVAVGFTVASVGVTGVSVAV